MGQAALRLFLIHHHSALTGSYETEQKGGCD
jgi:hypothetical protein